MRQGSARARVQVSRPGVTLAYRKGYYADDPNSKAGGQIEGTWKAEGHDVTQTGSSDLKDLTDP